MGQLIVIVAMFVVLWIVLILPQRRRAQAQRELHSSVVVDDEILIAGGLYGHVRAIDDEDVLLVEIAPRTQVRVARRAVAAKISPEASRPALDAADAEPDEEPRS